MSTFVLVHPAWFGGWCWKKLVPLLRAPGHDVHTPTLTGLGERAHLATPDVGLATHIDDVVNLVEFEDLHDVILVGNSSAGMVIAGVADRVPERIGQIVYLDAFVPSDGQSLWDMIPPERRSEREQMVESEGDGWLLPRFATAPWKAFAPEAWAVTDEADLRWALPRLRPTPFRHFTDALPPRLPGSPTPPRVFIRCRRWPHPGFDRYAAHAEATSGWRSIDMDSGHLPYITDPAQLATVLLDLAV